MLAGKILLCVSDSDYTGAPIYVDELKNILEPDFKVSLVVAKNGALLSGFELGFDKSKFFALRDIKAVFRFLNLIRKTNPDIVWINSFKMSVVVRSALFLSRSKIKVIYTIHGLSFVQGKILRNFAIKSFEKILKKYVGLYVFLTEYDRLVFKRMIGNQIYSEVVPNFSRLQGTTEERVKIVEYLMPARYDSQKDHMTLLKAWRLFESGRKNVRLTLVGRDTDCSELIKIIRDLELQDTVRVLGEQSDMKHFYTSCDCLVLCTHYEGMPLVLLEGMSYGLPVIATNVSGLSEIVTEDVGILVESNNVKSMLAGLESMAMLEEKEIRILSKSARDKYLKYYSMNAFKENIYKIIAKTL